MEYRDQVLACAQDEAATVLDGIAPEPILGLARRAYAAVRFQGVIWDWCGVQTAGLLENLVMLDPEDFFWDLCEFGMADLVDDDQPDPYMIETIDAFMAASPFRQAQVYRMLHDRMTGTGMVNPPGDQPAMLPVAISERDRLASNWAFQITGGPPPAEPPQIEASSHNQLQAGLRSDSHISAHWGLPALPRQ